MTPSTPEIDEAARKIRPKLRMAICLAILAAVLMSSSIKDIAQGHFTETWMITQGKIISSSILRVHRMQFPASVVARPEFTYSFIVNGQLLESKDNAFDKTDDKSVSDIVAKYPDGKEVTVHYLRNNPNESYFEHDGSSAHSQIKVVAFVGGFLLLLVAMQIMFRLRREIPRTPRIASLKKPPMSS